MSCHSANIDAETSWEIHEREAWSAQQKILVDSINDTARMARTALSLVLLVALYLLLTLVASTDEQLLRESQVSLPQANIGISIKASYIVAPPVFLYLHVQALFLLGVLMRKIQRFKKVVDNSPRVRTHPHTTKTQDVAKESWDWLSAFVFVELFRPNGCSRWLPLVLSYISIAIIPILLLTFVDLSFVRYQSDYITPFHHSILILDIIFVWLFSHQIRRRLFSHSLFLDAISIAMLGGVILLIIYYAQPPQLSDIGDFGSGYDREDVWKKSKNEKFSYGRNPFDSFLCNFFEFYRLCRYTDVNDQIVTNTWVESPDSISTGSDNKNIDAKRLYVNEFNLADRKLRYACFRSAGLYRVDLSSADLRGADFGSAEIHRSDFSRAKLHGVNFVDTILDDVDFGNAELHRADLSGAALINMDLRGAELHGADLSNMRPENLTDTDVSVTKICVPSDLEKEDRPDPNSYYMYDGLVTILHGADLRFVELYGADLRNAELHVADLRGAKLHGADLSGAKLHGANLERAELHGANLADAELYGANIEGIELDGAILENTKLAGSSGTPKSWNGVWMSNTSWFFSSAEKADQIIDTSAREFEGVRIDRMNKVKKFRTTWTDHIRINWEYGIPSKKYGTYLAERIRGNMWNSMITILPDLPERNNKNIFYRNINHDFPHYIHPPYFPEWLPSDRVDEKYWRTRSVWTTTFACKNKYTAGSILKRWMSDTPLPGIKPDNPLPDTNSDALKTPRSIIICALDEMRKKEMRKKGECPGLHAVTDDEWNQLLLKYEIEIQYSMSQCLSPINYRIIEIFPDNSLVP